jgi:hypothetical protein
MLERERVGWEQADGSESRGDVCIRLNSSHCSNLSRDLQDRIGTIHPICVGPSRNGECAQYD